MAVGLLLRLDLLAAPHAADQRTRRRADRRPLTRVARDRAADRAHRGSSRGAPHPGPAPGHLLRRGWGRRARPGGGGGVEPRLLHGPDMALPAVGLLLLRGLAAIGI